MYLVPIIRNSSTFPEDPEELSLYLIEKGEEENESQDFSASIVDSGGRPEKTGIGNVFEE